MEIHIGCSGWNYKDWRGKFYPEDLPQKEWLEFYAKKFKTVEVNNTFYQFPKDTTMKKWRKTAPGDFKFTLKGSRYITHMKKLNDVDESVQKFYDVSKSLKNKLGCLLWQLPPNQHRDDEKLQKFCKNLDARRKNIIEFRHDSWFHPEVYEILSKKKIGICAISSPDFPEEMMATTKFGYVRFHGKSKDWYNYRYSKSELKDWAEKIKKANMEEVFVYFNNDYHANAPDNAEELREMLG